MRNPNILRPARLLSGAALLAAGAIACSGKGSPTPPPETTANKPVEAPPACKIAPTPDTKQAHTMHFNLETTNTDRPGSWQEDHNEFVYGDGASGREGLHTYPHAGKFTVHASVVLDVAPGVSFPSKDHTVGCPPVTVTVP